MRRGGQLNLLANVVSESMNQLVVFQRCSAELILLDSRMVIYKSGTIALCLDKSWSVVFCLYHCSTHPVSNATIHSLQSCQQAHQTLTKARCHRHRYRHHSPQTHRPISRNLPPTSPLPRRRVQRHPSRCSSAQATARYGWLCVARCSGYHHVAHRFLDLHDASISYLYAASICVKFLCCSSVNMFVSFSCEHCTADGYMLEYIV